MVLELSVEVTLEAAGNRVRHHEVWLFHPVSASKY